MDCRKTLRLALLLLCCTAGCETLWSTSDPKDKLSPVDKDTGKIRPIFAEQTKLKPETLVAHAHLMETALTEQPEAREQHLERARNDYRRALEADPRCMSAYEGLALLQENSGNHERATETFRQALKVSPNEKGIWFELGVVEARHKEWEPSLDALRKAVELDPENKLFLKMLGMTLAAAGRYEESYTCLKPLVGEAEAQCIVARMLHHMKQDDAAREHVQLALQANANLKTAQDLLAELNGAAPVEGQTEK